ncbi:MAG: VOC family protein [Myxococcota bacterium]|nr:VOC family protein [Myxococcota bacterium]
MPMPAFHQQVIFIDVSNLETSTTFYRQVLGLPLVLDQGTCRIFRVTETSFIGVCTGRPPSPEGVIITLVHPDLDAWHTHLIAHGVPIKKAPAFNEKYNIEHLFAMDPDGYAIEIQCFHDPSWPSVHST